MVLFFFSDVNGSDVKDGFEENVENLLKNLWENDNDFIDGTSLSWMGDYSPYLDRAATNWYIGRGITWVV